MDVADHRVVFVGGLHRSGTTPLARCLAEHPQVSGFAATGVKEDEGQHLQTVYPPAREHGGPGRFAHSPGAHLTERSELATPENAERLFEQWKPYWDLSRPVLVEKSPPNILMTRFLQALYPKASFVIVVRHPVVVALSTRKWVGGSWRMLLDNWFRAHDVLRTDSRHIDRLHVLKYEDLVAEPKRTLGEIATFLELDGDVPADTIQPDRSLGYERRWRQLAESVWPWQRAQHRWLCRRYEDKANSYGYSLVDLHRWSPFSL